MADNNLQLTTNITQSSLSAAVSSSVPSSKPAMSLEARAAQLREKLIRSREKSRARTTKETETPAPLTTAADTRPIHHQQPPQNSFVPDADDVAELISSFSSAEPSSFSGVLALGSSISPTKPPGSLRLQKAPSNQVGESAKSSSNQPPASHLEVSLEEGEKSIHSGHDSAAASKPVINMPGRASTLSDESPQPTSVANGKKMWKDDYQEAPQASGETLPVLSPADVMQRLLKQVPDLSDWLELTEYHDAESRAKKLDRYRRAKQIAAKRKEIEEEERKLMEEEVREKEMQRTRAANVTSPNIAASLLMSAIPNPPGAMNDRPSRKRSYNDDVDRERRGKAYRSGHGPSRAHERRRTYDSYWDGEDREYPYRRY